MKSKFKVEVQSRILNSVFKVEIWNRSYNTKIKPNQRKLVLPNCWKKTWNSNNTQFIGKLSPGPSFSLGGLFLSKLFQAGFFLFILFLYFLYLAKLSSRSNSSFSWDADIIDFNCPCQLTLKILLTYTQLQVK